MSKYLFAFSQIDQTGKTQGRRPPTASRLKFSQYVGFTQLAQEAGGCLLVNLEIAEELLRQIGRSKNRLAENRIQQMHRVLGVGG